MVYAVHVLPGLQREIRESPEDVAAAVEEHARTVLRVAAWHLRVAGDATSALAREASWIAHASKLQSPGLRGERRAFLIQLIELPLEPVATRSADPPAAAHTPLDQMARPADPSNVSMAVRGGRTAGRRR